MKIIEKNGEYVRVLIEPQDKIKDEAKGKYIANYVYLLNEKDIDKIIEQEKQETKTTNTKNK
jgi:hypothetical protein